MRARRPPSPRIALRNGLLTGLLLAAGASGCSRGGLADEGPPPDLAAADLAAEDLAIAGDLAAAPDLAVTPVQACTWRERFQQVYGRPFSGADLAFVTGDGAVTRGTDKLDFAAQKNQVPDTVKVKGNGNAIREIRLLSPDGSQVLASRSGKYVYGLGYAMWLEVNGSSEAGFAEMTLLRQLTMEEPSYQQLVAVFRALTKTSEGQVPAADLGDYQQAAAQLLRAIEGGQLTFVIGTGHAADFPQTAQTVNGKKFSFQLSAAFGMDPQLGLQRDGSWGPKWQTWGPSGAWSASQPGLQPKCGGCVVSGWAGGRYQLCEGPLDWAGAEAACQARGGHLATVGDAFVGAFLRSLDPRAGDTWMGLNDRAAEGQYVWASGAAAPYRSWTQGQPDDYMGKEDCAELYDGARSTQWNDLDCAERRSYLCELP